MGKFVIFLIKCNQDRQLLFLELLDSMKNWRKLNMLNSLIKTYHMVSIKVTTSHSQTGTELSSVLKAPTSITEFTCLRSSAMTNTQWSLQLSNSTRRSTSHA